MRLPRTAVRDEVDVATLRASRGGNSGLVARLRAAGIVEREFPELEYEVKFRVNETVDALTVLRAVVSGLAGDARYLIDAVETSATLRPTYYSSEGVEYSLFEYEGAPLLKIKKHRVLEGHAFPIFCASERFLRDIDEITACLRDRALTPVGSLIKARVKDFLVDTYDGRFYSIAMTVCTVGDRVQRQLEVEYAGAVDLGVPIDLEQEGQLTGRLVEVSRALASTSLCHLIPDRERKFEFLMGLTPGASSTSDGPV